MLSTRGLRRIVEYAPEDQTVTVEAGVTVAELAETLAVHGQRLMLDVAEPARATIGGALAANAFGARRMRFGSLKDLILGVSLVRADGVAVRAGGKVVKNVAGFDLSKLVVGSHGTLALIATATLRVHPLPQAARTLRIERFDAALVWDAVLAFRQRALEPVAVNALRRAQDSGCYDLDVAFEGFRAGVDAQIDRVVTLAAERGWSAREIAPEVASADDAGIRAGAPLRVRYAMLPSDFAAPERFAIVPLLDILQEPVAVAYPSLGIVIVAGTPKATSAVRDVVAGARAYVERRGGSLVVETQPDCDDGSLAIEPWGTPPASLFLMQALKARFDPDGRLGAGFVGGLS